MGYMCSRIPTPAARASARNGCIRSRSTSTNCGAMTRRSDPPYRWMPGNRTSNLPEAMPLPRTARQSRVAARSRCDLGRIERRAYPAAILLASEFVRQPVVLIESQRDDVGLPVPTDGFQPQRRAVGLVAHRPDEGVEIGRRLAIHFRDAAAGI